MKNKYQRMTKTEKKELKQKFYETTKGKEMKKRLLRLRITGLIGILFSVFLVISGYISKEKEYKTINITLLVIAFFIYLYFMMLNYKRIKRNTHQSFKQMRINNANFLAATLIVLATIIYIMTSILSTNELEILP